MKGMEKLGKAWRLQPSQKHDRFVLFISSALGDSIMGPG